MNSDTQAALQYLATLIEVIESRGLADGSFRAEVLNEIMEVNRDPDYKGEMRPTGKSMMSIVWTWAVTDVPQMIMTSEGEEIDFGEFNGR